MNPLRHAVVWIDHREAKVYRFSAYDESALQVTAHNSLEPLHHRRGGWEAGGAPREDGEFFQRVAGTLDQTDQILVTGPGDARLAFKTHMDRLLPHRAQVSTLELLDQPSDEALLTLGREHFHMGGSPAQRDTLNTPVL